MDPEETADDLLADEEMLGDAFAASEDETDDDPEGGGDDAAALQEVAAMEMLEASRDNDVPKFIDALNSFLDSR